MKPPMSLFQDWLIEAGRGSALSHPRAACLSTVDADGAPDARMVDLKRVTEEGLVFSTSLESGKARAIATNPRVALTFWWDAIERQIRICGMAERVSDVDADALFRPRSREAQLASWASTPGIELDDPALLELQLSRARERFAGTPIPRPAQWSAFQVVPGRIEFLRFQQNRLHHRLLYLRDGSSWRTLQLQP